jgi:hypothetical protein
MTDWMCARCDGTCQTYCHLKRHHDRLATDQAYRANYLELVAEVAQKQVERAAC